MESGEVIPAVSKHSRTHSKRPSVVHQASRGPLDEADPLSAKIAIAPATPSPSLNRPTSRPPPSISRTSTPVTHPSEAPSPFATPSTKKDFAFLLRPEIFHTLSELDIPSPFRDPLNPVIPPNLQNLLSTGRFHAAAVLASESLRSFSDPYDFSQILHFFHIRLACLTLLNHHFEAAQEAKALQDLNGPFYRDVQTGRHLAPWPLRVLAVRLQAIGFGDWRRGVMGYYELSRECRYRAHRREKSNDVTENKVDRTVWGARLRDLGLRIADALLEMGDAQGAIRHLRTLNFSEADYSIQVRLALVFVRCGDVDGARAAMMHDQLENDEKVASTTNVMLSALVLMSDDKFEEAVTVWKNVQSTLLPSSPSYSMVTQNLAVCLVYAGQISDARTSLEQLVANDKCYPIPSATTFNLATIFELCSESAPALKVQLAQNVASRMEMNNELNNGLMFDRSNVDFKL